MTVGKRLKTLGITATAAALAVIPAAAAHAGVGNGTWLNQPSAWVHFLPTVGSDHLTIVQGHDIAAVCKVTDSGGVTWDLVLDHNLDYAGYTFASYLNSPANQWCTQAGTQSHIIKTAWAHLHPDASWEYQVMNLGDPISVMCSRQYWNSNTAQWVWWDLVVDHNTNMTGFVTDDAAYGSTPASSVLC